MLFQRSLVPLALLSCLPAFASLQPKVTFSGQLKLSVDGSGSNTGSAIIRADKPSVNATVHAAYLLAASTGFTGYQIQPGDIGLDGTPITFTDSLANSIFSNNYWTDVSAIVRGKLNAAPAGIVNFTVTEGNTELIDGEILAVIWDEPSAAPTTVSILFGAQSTTGDSFTVNLAHPIDKTNPATVLDMSLGISYGYQPDGQYSLLEMGLNGTRISTSAGGQDDSCHDYDVTHSCPGANGSLITAGGIGDLNDNPPDPFAIDLTCLSAAGNPAPRCDDELYNLLPFLSNGTQSFTVYTLNPSNDDNIFFAAFVLGANTAVVGEGILLSPALAAAPKGSTQTVDVHVQSSTGNPINGRAVTLKVISGPNVGLSGTVATNASGDALFSYSSAIAGSDTIQGCMTNSSGLTQCSNQVVRTWTGVNGINYDLMLMPASDTNPVGTQHMVTAEVFNSTGQPVGGVPVKFTVKSGPEAGAVATVTTDASGKATATFSSANPGTDAIVAAATLGGVVQTSNTVSKLWVARTGKPIISLSPLTSTTPVNGQLTLVAKAFDATGTPVPGITITFIVLSGPNFGTLGTAVTNASGVATDSYIGHTTGLDTIQASGAISSIATTSNIVPNTWSGLLCDLDNNGQIDNRDITAIFQDRNTLAGPGDVRDANFDGKIDALDLRICTLRCSKAGCNQ
jgi:5-hydroxyisourate hydrolase-like protein (transthyretin family)